MPLLRRRPQQEPPKEIEEESQVFRLRAPCSNVWHVIEVVASIGFTGYELKVMYIEYVDLSLSLYIYIYILYAITNLQKNTSNAAAIVHGVQCKLGDGTCYKTAKECRY